MKKLLITSAILIGLAGAGGAALTQQSGTAEDNTPTRVDQLEGRVDNHEARITNTEADVSDLQQSTGTPPSSSRTEVPTQQANPQAPAPAATEQPTPVTVLSFEVLPADGTENADCKYTYSDGTSLIFLWRTVSYNQGVRIVHNNGVCDNSVIGIKQ